MINTSLTELLLQTVRDVYFDAILSFTLCSGILEQRVGVEGLMEVELLLYRFSHLWGAVFWWRGGALSLWGDLWSMRGKEGEVRRRLECK